MIFDKKETQVILFKKCTEEAGNNQRKIFTNTKRKSEVWLMIICYSSNIITHHPSGTTNPFMGSQISDKSSMVVPFACTPHRRK